MPNVPNPMFLTMWTILRTLASMLLWPEKAVTSWEVSVKKDAKIKEKTLFHLSQESNRGAAAASQSLTQLWSRLPCKSCSDASPCQL